MGRVPSAACAASTTAALIAVLATTAPAYGQNALERFRDRLRDAIEEPNDANRATDRRESAQSSTDGLGSVVQGEAGGPDVFGIQIGMTKDEVLATIRERDPTVRQTSGGSRSSPPVGQGVLSIITNTAGRSGPRVCAELSLARLLQPRGSFTCEGMDYTLVSHGNETQLVGATLLNGLVIAVSFSHARGDNRFSFDPSDVVQEKYGTFETRNGATTKEVQTPLGTAELRFRQRAGPGTNDVLDYSIRLILARDALDAFVRRYTDLENEGRSTVDAPPL